jgi:hypothetical protein
LHSIKDLNEYGIVEFYSHKLLSAILAQIGARTAPTDTPLAPLAEKLAMSDGNSGNLLIIRLILRFDDRSLDRVKVESEFV